MSATTPFYGPYLIPRSSVIIDLESPPSSPDFSATDSGSDDSDLDELEDLSLDDQGPDDSGLDGLKDLSLEDQEPTPESHTEQHTATPSPQQAQPQLSPLGHLLKSLEAAKRTHSPKAEVDALKTLITNHMHHNTLTLADAELLFPAHNSAYPLTKKASAQIANDFVWGRTSAADHQAIVEHIFAAGDEKYYVFNHVRQQVDKFRAEKLSRSGRWDTEEKWRRRVERARVEEKKRVEGEEQRWEEIEADRAAKVEQRMKTFPERWRVPFGMPDAAPKGFTCFAHFYAEACEMDWQEAKGKNLAPERKEEDGSLSLSLGLSSSPLKESSWKIPAANTQSCHHPEKSPALKPASDSPLACATKERIVVKLPPKSTHAPPQGAPAFRGPTAHIRAHEQKNAFSMSNTTTVKHLFGTGKSGTIRVKLPPTAPRSEPEPQPRFAVLSEEEWPSLTSHS